MHWADHTAMRLSEKYDSQVIASGITPSGEFHIGHLRLMEKVVEMGGIIFPPVPAFYPKPTTLESLITHTSGRALEQLGLKISEIKRWMGPAEANNQK